MSHDFVSGTNYRAASDICYWHILTLAVSVIVVGLVDWRSSHWRVSWRLARRKFSSWIEHWRRQMSTSAAWRMNCRRIAVSVSRHQVQAANSVQHLQKMVLRWQLLTLCWHRHSAAFVTSQLATHAWVTTSTLITVLVGRNSDSLQTAAADQMWHFTLNSSCVLCLIFASWVFCWGCFRAVLLLLLSVSV